MGAIIAAPVLPTGASLPGWREAETHGFDREVDAECVEHRPTHVRSEVEHVGRGRSAKVHKGEGVSRGHTDSTSAIASLYARMLDEPRRRHLRAAESVRIHGDLVGPGEPGFVDRGGKCLSGLRRHRRVREEGTDAAAIPVSYTHLTLPT